MTTTVSVTKVRGGWGGTEASAPLHNQRGPQNVTPPPKTFSANTRHPMSLCQAPAAPGQLQTPNEEDDQRRRWVDIVNGMQEVSNATYPESAMDELLRINPAAAEERRFTCQHEGCEFEGTNEDVQNHEESCGE